MGVAIPRESICVRGPGLINSFVMGRRHVDQLLMLSQERFLSVPLGLWSRESYVCSITLQVPEYTLQNIPSVLNHSTL